MSINVIKKVSVKPCTGYLCFFGQERKYTRKNTSSLISMNSVYLKRITRGMFRKHHLQTNGLSLKELEWFAAIKNDDSFWVCNTTKMQQKIVHHFLFPDTLVEAQEQWVDLLDVVVHLYTCIYIQHIFRCSVSIDGKFTVVV